MKLVEVIRESCPGAHLSLLAAATLTLRSLISAGVWEDIATGIHGIIETDNGGGALSIRL